MLLILVFSLACVLEDYIRNVEAINFRWNRINPLKVFHILLYQWSSILIFTFYIAFEDLLPNWFSMRVSNDQRYVRGDRFDTRIIIRRKFKGLDSREITPWWEHGTWFQSSPKINCMLITRLICIQYYLHQL